MTRLTKNEVKDIKGTIKDHSDEIKEKTGLSLQELAAQIAKMGRKEFSQTIESKKVAAITITSGQGEIGHFAESVAAIIEEVGAKIIMPAGTDVVAISSACQAGGDILFMADDNKFIGLNLENRKIGENKFSTALGYITMLEAFSVKKYGETIKGKKVLVLGYGDIGKISCDILTSMGAIPVTYDIEAEKNKQAEERGLKVLCSKEEISEYKYVLDGTSQGSWMSLNMINEDALISSFGVPPSLDEEDKETIKDRIITDTLAIGVATMLALTVRKE